MITRQSEEILLFPAEDSPNSIPTSEEKIFYVNGVKCVSGHFNPKMEVFFPNKNANGLSIIICPGGGYEKLAIDLEGNEVAETLIQWGITVFVLKYRFPNGINADHEIPLPLIDIKKAYSIVQQRAHEWGLNPARIGLMGFSAGGHLASLASCLLSNSNPKDDGLNFVAPLFTILIYPVISFSDAITHMGSRNHFLGPSPNTDLIKQYSSEYLVHLLTPPAFLIHCSDDKDVSVENSLAYHKACMENGVSAEIHIYPKGGHGFGMNNTLVTENWMDQLQKWLYKF